MRFIRGILGLALALIFVLFAIANRQSVSVTWSPFHPATDLPLYAVALDLLAFGFLLGLWVAWLESIPARLEKTRQKRRIKTLEKELKVKETQEEKYAALPATPQNWTALPPTEPLEKMQ